MNKELLIDIFKIPAPSGFEDMMSFFVKNKLKEMNIDFQEDETGNIYNISHNGSPLLSAHLDTVQDDVDVKLTDFIRLKQGIISGYGVIGGDDKCGIFLILEALKYNNKINFVFFVQEESGGVGSSFFIRKNTLSNIPYCLVLDRRGNGDIICTSNNYGTKDFETFLIEIGKEFSYKKSAGTFSDADNLNSLISCANISVGYYNAHTKNEYVNIRSD